MSDMVDEEMTAEDRADEILEQAGQLWPQILNRQILARAIREAEERERKRCLDEIDQWANPVAKHIAAFIRARAAKLEDQQ